MIFKHAYLASAFFLDIKGHSIFCTRKLLPKVIFSMENVWVIDMIISLNCWVFIANKLSITQNAANDIKVLLAIPGPSSPPLPRRGFHLEREENKAKGTNWHFYLPQGTRSKAFLQMDKIYLWKNWDWNFQTRSYSSCFPRHTNIDQLKEYL